MTLLIGNRNYSSWSLRAWLALRNTALPFTEERVPLFSPNYKERIRAFSPAGLVPALRDGDTLVWDTMAIIEYLAEAYPALWPADKRARAHARAISAEMHAGFQALRGEMPMNIRATGRVVHPTERCQGDIARIQAIWAEARTRFGIDAGGPWLYGAFSAADAFYAPVAARFRTYGAALDDIAAAYVDTVFADPHMQDWIAAAEAEPEVIEAVERGRP